MTPLLKKNPKFRKETIRVDNISELSPLRLTIDYPSDFLVLSSVLSVSISKSLFGTELVKDVFSNYPWIFEVNQSNTQNNSSPA